MRENKLYTHALENGEYKVIIDTVYIGYDEEEKVEYYAYSEAEAEMGCSYEMLRLSDINKFQVEKNGNNTNFYLLSFNENPIYFLAFVTNYWNNELANINSNDYQNKEILNIVIHSNNDILEIVYGDKQVIDNTNN